MQKFPFTLGRDLSNDLCVSDDQCSRFHVKIKKRGRIVVIEDMGSKNGTFVNGESIRNHVLQSGDRILIGNTEIEFHSHANELEIFSNLIDMQPRSEQGESFNYNQIVRHDLKILANQSIKEELIKDLFFFQKNLNESESMEEVCQVMAKAVSTFFQSARLFKAFAWLHEEQKISQVFSKKYGSGNLKVELPLLKEAFKRKKLIIYNNSQKNSQQLIFPVMRSDEFLGLIYLDFKQQKNFEKEVVPLLFALINSATLPFELALLRKELSHWTLGMMEAIIATVEAKDTYTRGHSERVSRYSLAIAEVLGLNHQTKQLLMISAICHDVGKIGIPDSILKKASILSHDEYQEMQMHPTIGAEIMQNIPKAERFISGVKYHHEKWDGTGYPDGLVGEEIPFFARIIAVADAFDAMVSGRTYSGFLDQNEAVETLVKTKDLFDPEILKAFQKAWDDGILTLKTDTINKEEPIQQDKEKKSC